MVSSLSTVFIGRRYELEYIARQSKILGIPARDLLFMCGPSGIGKTRLSLESVKLLEQQGIPALHISIGSYDSFVDAINSITRQIDEYIEEHRVWDKIISAIERVFKNIRISVSPLNPFTQMVNVELLSSRDYGILDTLYKVFEKLSDLLYRAGGGLVFIDELQNILRLSSNWSPYGIFKFFSTMQEYRSQGYVRFILVTSDYLFRKEVIANVPGEYITTFYLGEMTYSDTLSLIELYTNRMVRDEKLASDILDKKRFIADIVGGTPAMIISLIKKAIIYDSVSRAIDTLAKTIVEDTLVKVMSTMQTRRVDAKQLLTDLTKKPLRVEEVIQYNGFIDDLVKYNILQYANSSYLGIYKWNESLSGGEGGLDVVAPSTRLHLYALCEIMESESSVCVSLRKVYDRVKSID